MGALAGHPDRAEQPLRRRLITVRDAIFGADGQLVYDDNSESSVMGDVNLINGKPWPTMQVEPRKYRFRILNASVSRSYRFALTQADNVYKADLPMTVIATDGGLMPKPQTVTSFRHGMAERYEIIIDFAKFRGKKLYLKNLQPRTTSTTTSCQGRHAVRRPERRSRRAWRRTRSRRCSTPTRT